MADRVSKGCDNRKAEGDSEAFLDWLERLPDPRERYRRATEELERHQDAVARLSSLRAAATADAYASGETIRGLAEEFDVSPARVHQLIQTASERSKAPVPGRRSQRRNGEKK